MCFFFKTCIFASIILFSSITSRNELQEKVGNYSYSIQTDSKRIKLTYYWIAIESEFPIVDGTPTTYLKTCKGTNLKLVSKKFQERVKMEGSGLLTNGKFINCGDEDCDCFGYVDSPKGSQDNPLYPYTSVAANDLKFGMKLFIKELKGAVLPPSKQVHNGCVRVDDKGWSFDGSQIDWYVFDHRYYEKLDAVLNLNKVTATLNSDCTILRYKVPMN